MFDPNIINPQALAIEPRIADADFEFSQVMDFENDFAFISGSVVEGFGNETSDVDIYIVTSLNPSLPDGIKFGYTNYEKGYYNEAIVMHYDFIHSVAARISGNNIDYNAYDFEDTMELYYRFAIGVPIVNCEFFKKEVHSFSKALACEVYSEYYKRKCCQFLKISMFLVNNNMSFAAKEYIRRAFESGLDYWLACRGEAYNSRKFRFLKLARIVGEDSKEYKEYWSMHNIGQKRSEDYLEEILCCCNKWGIDTKNCVNDEVICSLSGNIESIKLSRGYFVFNGNNVYSCSDKCLDLLSMLKESDVPATFFLKKYPEGLDCTLRELIGLGIVTIK